MMEKFKIPDNLKPFKKAAREYLEMELIKNIEFSGPTYQILMQDRQSGQNAWIFLQLDEHGQIGDCLCDYEEASEDSALCEHLCAAFMTIYNRHQAPLHHRFERSLWNSLCRLYFERLGAASGTLEQVNKGHYVRQSAGGKLIVEFKATSLAGATFLRELLEHRREPTQETSLKFSNLSIEELILWEEGHPSRELQYELSFWSDLAKWLMLQQEQKEAYTIEFGAQSSERVPNQIKIKLSSLELRFYLSTANLPAIIPSLNSVKSPLKVYQAPEEEIEKIIFDKERCCLKVIPSQPISSKPKKGTKPQAQPQGIPYERWLYVPNDGFYAKEPHHLLTMGTITAEEIPKILTEHHLLLSKLLEDVALHSEPMAVSYSLSFDADWNLHIGCYLFSPGDLSCPYAYFFVDWAYIDDDGFYRLTDVVFENVDTIVKAEEVPHFIAKNRSWLTTHEGFHIHVTPISAQLSYTLDSNRSLSFTRALTFKEGSESCDFGPWVYVSGEGFYAKESPTIAGSLDADIILRENQIPLFIKVNRQELQLVPGFFADRSPVVRALIDIEFTRKRSLIITPYYELAAGCDAEMVLFFDDLTYIADQGFCEIPADCRLPERYRHTLTLEDNDVDEFVALEIEKLKPYLHHVDPCLVRPTSLTLNAARLAKDENSNHGYIAKLYYHSEQGNVPATALWQAIKQKERFLFSEAGLIELSDKRFHWISWLHKRQVDRRSHEIQLSPLELIRLHLLETIGVPRERSSEGKHAQTVLHDLMSFSVPELPNLEGFESQLRSYQSLGVQWLWFLYQHGLSGLLCDDMGLGKTHQTMALIAAIKNSLDAKRQSHFLVVCPTSVIYHWQEKLQAFFPALRVLLFTGAKRDLSAFGSDYDLLLTSYGIYRLESEKLSAVPFELAVFDEVQIAKNHQSRTYAGLKKVNATMRLGLTGTPIENYLRELKALFDLVIPFYMPSDLEFRELFIKPIEREGSMERKKALGRMIKPFVMRRKKEDVLNDLPEKIEEIAHCDLTPEQRNLYNQVLAKGRAHFLDELQNSHSPVPFLHIFALLSSLKQICNHPATYLKCPEHYKEHSSGKWELFIELLSEARESSHKVVVYSQYLGMLDIIEEYLNEQGVGFASIRGTTTNRPEQLRRFKNDPLCEVFVASLHAAGLGIDLTAASVVIHYDRWWNAARENQATDRVYRIGQTKGVQVFKLVSKSSFEERIDQLIAQKAQLMDDVVSIDEHDILKIFSREELLAFLQEVPAAE
jgi:superfamily II DNA or RNA helicase